MLQTQFESCASPPFGVQVSRPVVGSNPTLWAVHHPAGYGATAIANELDELLCALFSGERRKPEMGYQTRRDFVIQTE
jgi:hypothetical protein